MKHTAYLRSCLLSLLLPLSLLPLSLKAQTIEGLWQQFDDRDGQLNSLVHIEIHNGEATATIRQGYPKPGKTLDPNARCVKCPPPFTHQPLIGLRFLWGLKGTGSVWTGGQILDPQDGKIYRAKATLSADGQRLILRGYLGVSLFGRNQTWVRVQL